MERLPSDSGSPPAVPSQLPASTQYTVRSDGDERVGVRPNTKYVTSYLGLLNLMLIIFLFTCWVSIAAVPKTAFLSVYKRTSAEEAYLFFGIVGWLLEITIYVVHLFDYQNKAPLNTLPVNLMLLGKDVFFVIPIFALSIASAVYETRERNASWIAYYYFNEGAFAAASFFGFVTVAVYATHLAFIARDLFGNKAGTHSNA